MSEATAAAALEVQAEAAQEYAWEGLFERSWEAVEEAADGSLRSLARTRWRASRREVQKGVRRAVVRSVFIVIDCSRYASEGDEQMKPSRLAVMQQLVSDFVCSVNVKCVEETSLHLYKLVWCTHIFLRKSALQLITAASRASGPLTAHRVLPCIACYPVAAFFAFAGDAFLRAEPCIVHLAGCDEERKSRGAHSAIVQCSATCSGENGMMRYLISQAQLHRACTFTKRVES
eukprot:1351967-Pleurochrysis_carterae.AAC.1